MLIREKYLSKIRGFYDSNLIKIFGIRRSGKSVILNQIIDELKTNRKVDDFLLYFLYFKTRYSLKSQIY